MDKVRAVDLFAGIGGMRLGAEKAANELGIEFECVLSCEKDNSARETYKKNFEEGIVEDAREMERLPDHDLLMAGFPCQSFSRAGKHEGFGDTRGTLFFEITRLIDNTPNPPEILVFENVRGLLTNDDGRTFKTIKHEIEKRGYSFNHYLLNSSNFGLPQNRVRLFMVCVLNENPDLSLVSDPGPPDSHSYEPGLFGRPTVVRDILMDDPSPEYNCSEEFVEALRDVVNGDFTDLHGVRMIDYRGGNSIHSWELGLRGECTDQEIEFMNEFILARRRKKFGANRDGKMLTKEQISTFFNPDNLQQVLDSLERKEYIQRVGEDNDKYKPVSGNFSFEVYKFLDPNKISVTLVSSDANRLGVYYNDRVRRITPREAARLQGFPDDFDLHDKDSKSYKLLGNSVSINVVKEVVKDVLKEKYEPKLHAVEKETTSKE